MQDGAGQDGTGAAELGRGIEAGRVDPRALAEAYLARIAGHPDGAATYARTTPARAMAEAEAAADRARRGLRRHPLDGVPVSWKDNIDSQGVATEGGSRLLAGRVPEADATVLARATAAGLVCLGKTHLSELAFSGLGVNPMTATAPNALDPERAPGGSSSGAASSVALGMAAAAVGTDTGGSIRIPSAWQGLVGLKTTAGLLPTTGVIPLAPSLDTVGPITRSVEDAGLMLSVLAGVPPVEIGAAAPDALAFLVPTGTPFEGADAAVLAGFEAAVERLAAAGARIQRAPVPELADTLDVGARIGAIVNFEAWATWGATIEANPGVMFAPIEARFRSGAAATAASDAAARAAFRRLGAAVGARIEDAGPLLMPTSACIAPLVERLLADEAHYVERNLTALRNTRLVNMLGLAALTVPSPAPMVGLMLVGAPFSEAALLRAGRAVEQALAG